LTSRTSYIEIISTLLVDILMLQAAWQTYALWLHINPSIFEFAWNISWQTSTFLLSIYWIMILAVGGMYTNVFLISRLDEAIRLLKTTFVGILLLFFMVTISQQTMLSDASEVVFQYWLVVFGFLMVGRLLVRTGQRLLARRGKNLRKAIIVGFGDQANDVIDAIRRHPTLGVAIDGQVLPPGAEGATVDNDLTLLGAWQELPQIVDKHQITDVIITARPIDDQHWLQLVDVLDMPGLSIKILPDFYQQIQGLNKTNQIFGLPLIEILTDPMPIWERIMKRILDFMISLVVLIISLPLMLLIGLLIRLSSEGPAIYKQKRVGRFGKEFTMYKFRTMRNNAESESGPVWAKEDDPRVTAIGKWLRKSRLDELPQFLNVLKGDMSLVGPRPERPHFVQKFKQQIPLYGRRLRVRPGITGWAQVKWKYDSSLNDVKEKIRYDLFYIENRSLRMDLKILVNTLVTVLRAKGL
jgi:exopolysaccharide biosynthesis polyprenyl glycosylphosphotransferase